MYNSSTEKMSNSTPLAVQLAVAGAANCVGAAVTNPLDLVKCRLQVSRGLAPTGGWIGVTASIVSTEGVVGLYRGLCASLLRESTYGAMRIGLYGPVRDAIAPSQGNSATTSGSPSFYVKIMAGLVSGCVAAAATNPADIVKVRAMVAHVQGRRGGVRLADEIAALVRQDGVLALWRGVWPNVQRAALVTAAQAGTYDEVKSMLNKSGVRWLTRQEGQRTEPLLLHVCSALCAALASALATTPVDTVKTRVMAAQTTDARALAEAGSGGGTLGALSRILHTEGLAGLYRGFWPTWARLTLHTVATFTAYEQLRSAVGMQPL